MQLEARAPFRLDLTVTVLRRLSTNAVDVLTPDGCYARAFEDGTILEVRQTGPDALEARFVGSRRSPAALVRRMLGIERDLSPFYRSVAGIGWLDALARRMRGVKPPSYPSLWEALVNAVVFQQVSLAAASAILRRTVEALTVPCEHRGLSLRPFPGAAAFAAADPEALRACGLSAAKVRTLRSLAEATLSGALDERGLTPLGTAEVIERLVALRGVGPWTASVVALRGLGRLDVFPLGDSGIGRGLPVLAGEGPADLLEILSALGDQRGLLYFHVLLGRLEAAGLLATEARR